MPLLHFPGPQSELPQIVQVPLCPIWESDHAFVRTCPLPHVGCGAQTPSRVALDPARYCGSGHFVSGVQVPRLVVDESLRYPVVPQFGW